MRRFKYFLIVIVLLLSFHVSYAMDKNSESLLTALSGSWKLQGTIKLKFRTYHPQGLYKVGKLFYMTSVELLEKPVPLAGGSFDRTPGKGIGHLFIFDSNGQLRKDVHLGEGSIYHPGGIDFDGKELWIPVAEYRPNSSSIIYSYDLRSGTLKERMRVRDHIGLVINLGDRLMGFTWGSERYYVWDLPSGKLLKEGKTPLRFVEYQDGQSLPGGLMFLSGIRKLNFHSPTLNLEVVLGGIAIVTPDFKVLIEVPVTQVSPRGRNVAWNPAFLDLKGRKLYFAPDDEETDLLIYGF